jgi:hypothetical protein
MNNNKIFLLGVLLISIIILPSMYASQFGYNNLDNKVTGTQIINGSNYSINVNNTNYLQGLTPQQVADLAPQTTVNTTQFDSANPITIKTSWLTNFINNLIGLNPSNYISNVNDTLNDSFIFKSSNNTATLNMSALDNRYMSGGVRVYWFTNQTNANGNRNMTLTLLNSSLATITTNLANNNEHEIASFITQQQSSPVIYVAGMRYLYLTGSLDDTNRIVQLQARVYLCENYNSSTDTCGTMTSYTNSTSCTDLESSYSTHQLSYQVNNIYSLNTSNRFIVKVYATKISGGTTNVNLQVDDMSYSRIEVPSPIGVTDISGLVPYTGATGDVDLGINTISNVYTTTVPEGYNPYISAGIFQGKLFVSERDTSAVGTIMEDPETSKMIFENILGDGFYFKGANSKVSTNGVFVSTKATGTAPYQCTSTTLNTNLNADLLDGKHGSEFLYLNQTTPQITTGIFDFLGGLKTTVIYDDNAGVKVADFSSPFRIFYDASESPKITLGQGGGPIVLNEFVASAGGFLKSSTAGEIQLDSTVYLAVDGDGSQLTNLPAPPGVLLLDQTTPQTVSNGQPIFTGGIAIDDGTQYIYSSGGTDMDFYVGDGIKQTITQAGNLLIGTTTDYGYKFQSYGTTFRFGEASDMFRMESGGSVIVGAIADDTVAKLQVLGSTIVYGPSNFHTGQLPSTSSTGQIFRADGVRHFGVKWTGTNAYFMDASNDGWNPDNWGEYSSYTPLLDLDFVNNVVKMPGAGNVLIGDIAPTFPASTALAINKAITSSPYAFAQTIEGTYTGSNSVFATWMNPTLVPGDANSAFFFYAGGNVQADSGKSVSSYGGYIPTISKSGDGTVATAYGLYLAEQNIGTDNWNLYSDGGKNYFGGNVLIGSTTDDSSGAKLQITGMTTTTGKVIVGSAIDLGQTFQSYGTTFRFGEAADMFRMESNGDVIVGAISDSGDNFQVAGTSFFDNNVKINGNLNLTNGNATINMIYGEMYCKNDSGCGKIDLVTSDVYVAMRNQTAGNLNGFTLNGATNLTAQHSGMYKAEAKVAVTAGSPAGEYGMKLYINETGQNNCYDHFHVASDQVSMVISCLVRINSGDNVSIRFDDHASLITDLTVYASNLNLLRIGD